MMPDVLILVGPTASGKSAVAYALAQRLNGEIVSADSMQIYREVPRLTAQPPSTWQQHIPHHCMGCVSVTESWSAGIFRHVAMDALRAIRARERLPIIVGGTGLYVRALLDGLAPLPTAQPAIRHQLEREIALHGAEAMHARLATIDPPAASAIHPHDARRIIRALEVYAVTDRPVSTLRHATAGPAFPWSCAMIGLRYPRALLYARINNRVARMFADGVLDEVRQLDARSISATASQMLGLRVLQAHLAGRMSEEEARQQLQQQTRQCAKRQMTWFRREARIQWLDGEALEPAAMATTIHQQQFVQHTTHVN